MDDFESGLTELAAKLRTTGIKRNAGAAAFLLRVRDALLAAGERARKELIEPSEETHARQSK